MRREGNRLIEYLSPEARRRHKSPAVDDLPAHWRFSLSPPKPPQALSRAGTPAPFLSLSLSPSFIAPLICPADEAHCP